MKILATFPGKLGDILWAMPTIRAISETYGVPIHFRCCASQKDFSSILPLLRGQDYLASAEVLADWQPREDGAYPFTPRAPELSYDDRQEYDRIYHLGYEGWPTPDLPRDVHQRARLLYDEEINPLDLTRPWITAPYPIGMPGQIALGFTDEHFELKWGVYMLLHDHFSTKGISYVALDNSPRWRTEGRHAGMSWEGAAGFLSKTQLFVGCCSALHVLACAMGVPVVLMEPAEGRHNAVFYPYGKTGPQVYLSTGGDGKPTWDSRHLIDLVDRIYAKHAPPAVSAVPEEEASQR